MNILVGCKIIAQEQDIVVSSDGSLDTSKANAKISQFDLNAIQAGIDIKALMPQAKVSAISVGGKYLENQKVKKDILSRGIDELNIAYSDKFETLLPHDTAEILSQMANKLGFDLIICADGSGDLFASQVGLRLGGLLGINSINGVSKIISIDDKKIVVQRELESEIEELEIALPALICVSTDINTPAIPGMKAILAAAKKPINEMNIDANLTDYVLLKEIKAPKKKERLGVIVDGDSDDKILEFIENIKKILN